MNGGTPLVSVVLPTYNRPERLRRAVKSVDEQTYGNVELIVVDDYSSTPAEQVLADHSFEDLRVRHLRHAENEGANTARNNGIEAARGEFIAFLDDDDEWVPTKLERQVAVFSEADPSVGVVYTGMRLVYSGGTRTVVNTTAGAVTRDILAGRSLAPFSAVMVRATVIEKAGLPDERFPSWQDREWYLRLSRHCRFEALPEPLTIQYRENEDRITKDFEAKRDVSYPLFLSKHRSLAREYGWVYERRFVATLSESVGREALRDEDYADARKYLLKAVVHYPFSVSSYLLFFAAFGGRYTKTLAENVRRILGTVLLVHTVGLLAIVTA